MEKKLEVKDLKISFRTSDGKLQAVRGIDFDLHKGETLAIVGESGSGKSVTSRAVLGILAGNSVVEGGEIIYDGKDLLKISEEELHKLRGDKIAMIFQDPMSSLNPIVKIGKQLTEAMILKGKARQKESRKSFNRLLGLLEKTMAVAIEGGGSDRIAREKCAGFDRFAYKHLELEKAYNIAYGNARDAKDELDSLIFELSKNAAGDLLYRTKRVARQALDSCHTYVVSERAERLGELAERIAPMAREVKKGGDSTAIVSALTEIREILKEALDLTAPNFFAMGYYLTFADEPLPDMKTEELNRYLRKYLDDNFMLAFISDTERALSYSAKRSYRKKQELIERLSEYRKSFEKDFYNKKECYEALRLLAREVREAIDPLEIVKDSLAYTFASTLKGELDRYFSAVAKSAAEKRWLYRQRGRQSKEQAAQAPLTDLSQVKRNILRQIDRLGEHYKESIARADERNYAKEAVAIIDFLKAAASGVVNRVTRGMAKTRALGLMEEVGIPDARIRYNQYPFEFSGGMRQRIVIAIALAADPDILICDEPTTALDVTIQAQILELINRLKRERNLSVIFITHDLGVVANMADRIAVMYAGKIVEIGGAEEVFYDPRHPYTWALLSSMPDLDTGDRLDSIPGTPPNMIFPPRGDAFAARNKYAMRIDFEIEPPMFSVSETHRAATWLLHPDAPDAEPPRTIRDRIERMKKRRGEEGDG